MSHWLIVCISGVLLILLMIGGLLLFRSRHKSLSVPRAQNLEDDTSLLYLLLGLATLSILAYVAFVLVR